MKKITVLAVLLALGFLACAQEPETLPQAPSGPFEIKSFNPEAFMEFSEKNGKCGGSQGIIMEISWQDGKKISRATFKYPGNIGGLDLVVTKGPLSVKFDVGPKSNTYKLTFSGEEEDLSKVARDIGMIYDLFDRF